MLPLLPTLALVLAVQPAPCCLAGTERLQPLITRLASAEPRERLEAVHALAAMRESASPALPALLARLRDPDHAVRVAVNETVWTLLPSGAPRAYLFHALEDDASFTDGDAVAALTRVLHKRGAGYTREEEQVGALELARRIGPGASSLVPDIVALLGDETVQKNRFRDSGFKALAHLGPQGVEALRPFVSSSDEDVRSDALDALSESPRAAAAYVPQLRIALHERWWGTREHAAMALGLVRPVQRETVDALVASLRDPEPHVRDAAAASLGWMGSDATPAVPALAQFLVDADSAELLDPRETFQHLGPAAAGALPELIRSLDSEDGWGEGTQTHEVLSAIGAPSIPALVGALRDSHPSIRLSAVRVLAEMPVLARAALPDLERAQSDPDPSVREEATLTRADVAEPLTADVAALTHQATAGAGMQVHEAYEKLSLLPKERLPEALPAFLQCLQNPSPNIARDVALALGRMGPAAAPAIPLMTARLARTDEDQSEMLEALRQLGPDARGAVPALCGVLLDPRAIDRAAAARALGAMGSAASEAAPLLEELLDDDDWDVAVVVADALWRIRGR